MPALHTFDTPPHLPAWDTTVTLLPLPTLYTFHVLTLLQFATTHTHPLFLFLALPRTLPCVHHHPPQHTFCLPLPRWVLHTLQLLPLDGLWLDLQFLHIGTVTLLFPGHHTTHVGLHHGLTAWTDAPRVLYAHAHFPLPQHFYPALAIACLPPTLPFTVFRMPLVYLYLSTRVAPALPLLPHATAAGLRFPTRCGRYLPAYHTTLQHTVLAYHYHYTYTPPLHTLATRLLPTPPRTCATGTYAPVTQCPPLLDYNTPPRTRHRGRTTPPAFCRVCGIGLDGCVLAFLHTRYSAVTYLLSLPPAPHCPRDSHIPLLDVPVVGTCHYHIPCYTVGLPPHIPSPLATHHCPCPHGLHLFTFHTHIYICTFTHSRFVCRLRLLHIWVAVVHGRSPLPSPLGPGCYSLFHTLRHTHHTPVRRYGVHTHCRRVVVSCRTHARCIAFWLRYSGLPGTTAYYGLVRYHTVMDGHWRSLHVPYTHCCWHAQRPRYSGHTALLRRTSNALPPTAAHLVPLPARGTNAVPCWTYFCPTRSTYAVLTFPLPPLRRAHHVLYIAAPAFYYRSAGYTRSFHYTPVTHNATVPVMLHLRRFYRSWLQRTACKHTHTTAYTPTHYLLHHYLTFTLPCFCRATPPPRPYITVHIQLLPHAHGSYRLPSAYTPVPAVHAVTLLPTVPGTFTFLRFA